MQIVLYILILTLGCASYAVGAKQMLKGDYKPSVFSRIVWVLLAINSFAGVIASHGSRSSMLLAGILLSGNIIICIISFWKGERKFGKLELISLLLLLISGVIWLVLDAPLINLAISLSAHFIGALPTYKKVWSHPASESTAFWSLFFGASVLSILASQTNSLMTIIFPIYFTVFDGSLFMLSIRGKLKNILKS